MKQHLNGCTFYFLICLLFALGRGPVYIGSQVLLILISFYYAVYANIHYRLPAFFKALNVLLIMFTIYGFLLIIKGEQLMIQVSYQAVSNNSYLLNIYRSLLPIYAFYVFARKGWLTEQTMKFWFFVFLILTIRSFYNNQASLLRKAVESGSSAEEFTNNVGYSFVALLPALVLFYKKPIIQYILMAVCGYFILMGMKRGAILSGAVCLAWFLYVNYKKTPKNRRWIVVIVSVMVVLAGVYFVQYMMNTSAYFVYRVEATKAGESSQRDMLYSTFYNHFIHEDNPFLFLFGNGANATLKIGENYAHNDWLAIAIDQGVLGLVIYAVYWICFFISWRKSKCHPRAFMAIGMLMIIYFLTTWFSMSFTSVTRCAAMVLGYYLAVYDMEEEPIIEEPQIETKDQPLPSVFS